MKVKKVSAIGTTIASVMDAESAMTLGTAKVRQETSGNAVSHLTDSMKLHEMVVVKLIVTVMDNVIAAAGAGAKVMPTNLTRKTAKMKTTATMKVKTTTCAPIRVSATEQEHAVIGAGVKAMLIIGLIAKTMIAVTKSTT
jgi:hypothetical protein